MIPIFQPSFERTNNQTRVRSDPTARRVQDTIAFFIFLATFVFFVVMIGVNLSGDGWSSQPKRNTVISLLIILALVLIVIGTYIWARIKTNSDESESDQNVSS